MKIIGITGRDEGMILLATKDEVAQLAGFYSSYSLDRSGIKLEAGQVVEVGKLYKDATELVNLYGEFRKEIQSGLNRMNKLAEMLNPKPAAQAGKP